MILEFDESIHDATLAKEGSAVWISPISCVTKGRKNRDFTNTKTPSKPFGLLN